MRSRWACLNGHCIVALKLTPLHRVWVPSILPYPSLVERGPLLKCPFLFRLGALALGPLGKQIVLRYRRCRLDFMLRLARTNSLLQGQLHTRPHSRPHSPLSPTPIALLERTVMLLVLSFSSPQLFHVHSTNSQNHLVMNGTSISQSFLP
ncbi:hypothetical protein BDR22DRAFT_873891 [Usnea florida]